MNLFMSFINIPAGVKETQVLLVLVMPMNTDGFSVLDQLGLQKDY